MIYLKFVSPVCKTESMPMQLLLPYSNLEMIIS